MMDQIENLNENAAIANPADFDLSNDESADEDTLTSDRPDPSRLAPILDAALVNKEGATRVIWIESEHLILSEDQLQDVIDDLLPGITLFNYTLHPRGARRLLRYREYVRKGSISGEIQLKVIVNYRTRRFSIRYPHTNPKTNTPEARPGSAEAGYPSSSKSESEETVADDKSEQHDDPLANIWAELRVPDNIKEWTAADVRKWIEWAIEYFSLSDVDITRWNMDGKGLLKLRLKKFQKKVPNDPEGRFWKHITAMKKN